jgi:hypothetical protein
MAGWVAGWAVRLGDGRLGGKPLNNTRGAKGRTKKRERGGKRDGRGLRAIKSKVISY